MSSKAKTAAPRILSESELDAVAGGIYVDPKKPKGPIIISRDPSPYHPPQPLAM